MTFVVFENFKRIKIKYPYGPVHIVRRNNSHRRVRDNKSITSCHTWRLTQLWRSRRVFRVAAASGIRRDAFEVTIDTHIRIRAFPRFAFLSNRSHSARETTNRAAIKVIAWLIIRALRKQEQDSRVIGAIWLIKKFWRLRERREREGERERKRERGARREDLFVGIRFEL